MKNEDVSQYYDMMAKNIKVATETRNKAKDFSQFDIQFMKQRSCIHKNLLDLGSGTGLLINALIRDFKHITAVEKYPNFSKFITQSPHVSVLNSNLLSLPKDLGDVDIISLFGVMNYFNAEEADIIYQQTYKLLKTGGQIIIKNQFGLLYDVTVDGYSEELGTNYYSNYRYVENEIALLARLGFKNIHKHDIYPAEYNRWQNTHFYALTAEK
jgi:SAM-dependent methyltransferase